MKFQTSGEIIKLEAAKVGWGNDLQVGFKITVKLPFGDAWVSVPAGVEPPALGDWVNISISETESVTPDE